MISLDQYVFLMGKMGKTESPDFGNLLYGAELERWLGSFPGMDVDQCLEKIDSVWAEKGFLEPQHLSAELLISALEPTPFQAQQEQQIRDMMKSAYPLDRLTDFADKPEAPLLTGLAHLYARRTGTPVSMVDGDYGNMGGTNEFYKQKMKEGGLGGRRYDDGFAETDKAARATAKITERSLQTLADQHPGAKLLKLRSGGDEIRLIMVGVENEKVEDWILTKTHPEIERFTAEANLHDHKHTKAPDNPLKNGFGLALAAVSLNQDHLKPDIILAMVDARINAEKLVLGAERRGEILALDDYPEETRMVEVERVRRQTWQFNKLKEQNPDPLAFIRNLDEHPKWGPLMVASDYSRALPIPIDLNKMTDRPFTDIFDRMHHQLDINMRQQMPGQPDRNRKIMHAALHMAMPIDHSAGVYGPRYEEITAASVHADSRRMGDNPAHLVHLEFGNLAGLNMISHHHADVVLKHIGTIIKEEMRESGLGGAEHNIFHQGGARFNSYLPNFRAVVDEKKNYMGFEILDETGLAKLGENINRRIDDEINDRPIADYFQERNVSILRQNDDGEMEMLRLGNQVPLIDEHGQKVKFRDMPHPKRDYETGINFMLSHQPMNDKPMALQIKLLNENAELRVNNKRAENRQENIVLQAEINDNQFQSPKSASRPASTGMTRKI